MVQKLLRLSKHSLVLEPPEIHPICPYRTLRARLVTIKGFKEPESFIDTVKYHLQKLGIENCEAYVPTNASGERDRKIITVHREHPILEQKLKK